jgi:hypothetical protein
MAGRFDLGRAFESVSDFEGARREWESVVAIDPDFQNVSARLAGLGAPKPDAADDGGFESFDGFMDGIDDSDDEDDDDVMAAEEIAEPEFADAEEIAAPEFAESEAIIELDEPADEVDAPPSARPKPAPKPAARRKKKKISFL